MQFTKRTSHQCANGDCHTIFLFYVVRSYIQTNSNFNTTPLNFQTSHFVWCQLSNVYNSTCKKNNTDMSHPTCKWRQHSLFKQKFEGVSERRKVIFSLDVCNNGLHVHFRFMTLMKNTEHRLVCTVMFFNFLLLEDSLNEVGN